MNGTNDINQILIFVRVTQARSFSEAARRLGMPKSTVSRKVSQLEERLGARLIHRSTRSFALTDAGRVLYERAAPAIGELAEAQLEVDDLRAEPSGVLRVSTPVAMGAMGPIVAEYMERHPSVQIDMVCTDRQVDLIEERFDLAIRAGVLPDSSMIVRKLGAARAILVASADYGERHGTPATPRELRDHACVHLGVGTALAAWSLESRGERIDVPISPRFTVNEIELLRSAIIAGAGIALLPQHACAAELKTGALVRVLPGWRTVEVPIHAVFPTRRQLSSKVLTFLDLVTQRLHL